MSSESISTIGLGSLYFTKIHQAVSVFWSWRHLPRMECLREVGDEAGSRADRGRQFDLPAIVDESSESISTIGVGSLYFTKVHQAVSVFWSWRHLPKT